MTTDTATPSARSSGSADRRPPRRRPDRRALATLASIALHAAILVPMALRLFDADIADRPPAPDIPIYIEIQPRPQLEGEPSRVPAPAAAVTAGQTRPLTGPTAILRAPVRAPEKEDERSDVPSLPIPRVGGPPGPAAVGAPAPPADIGAWQVVPESVGARVGRSMRLGAGGCRIMDGRLNSTEQRICDEAFNEAAGRARALGPRTLTPAEARRDAEFARQGTAALARYEARRAPLRAGVGVVGPSDGIGSNFGTGVAGAHLDPSFRQGADSVIRQDSNKLDTPRRFRGLTPPPE